MNGHDSTLRYFLKSYFSVDGTFYEWWYWLMHHPATGKKINGHCFSMCTFSDEQYNFDISFYGP